MACHFEHGPEVDSPAARLVFRVFRMGGTGVDLFFVLSGFLITRILDDARGQPRAFVNFYARRTLRIFPLYYGLLFVCFVLLPASGIAANPKVVGLQGWLWIYATNLYLSWRGAYVFDEFNHLWSLAVEEQFYLVWPLVVLCCRRRTAVACCLACLAVAPALRYLFAGRGNAVAAYTLTTCRVDALAAGALIALALKGRAGRGEPDPVRLLGRRAGLHAAAAGLLLTGLFLWKKDGGPMDAVTLVARFSLSAWLFAAVLVLALRATPGSLARSFWYSRILTFFGTYSYGLYVFHPVLEPALARLYTPESLALRLGSPVAGRLLAMALSGAASLVIAYLSFHLYERPFLRWKRRFH